MPRVARQRLTQFVNELLIQVTNAYEFIDLRIMLMGLRISFKFICGLLLLEEHFFVLIQRNFVEVYTYI